MFLLCRMEVFIIIMSVNYNSPNQFIFMGISYFLGAPCGIRYIMFFLLRMLTILVVGTYFE